MNRLCIAAAALLCASATGPAWARAITLAPVPVEGQEVKASDAGPTLISSRETSEAWVTPAGQRADQRLVLTVGVANDGDRTAEIDGGNIEVWTAEGARLAVYDLAGMEKEIKSKQAWAGFGAALAGGLANNTATYGYSRGSATVQGVALSFSNVMNASANATAAEVDGGLGQNLLQPTTVEPGQTGGGQVLVQKPPKGASALRVRISFAGDLHELRFDLKP